MHYFDLMSLPIEHSICGLFSGDIPVVAFHNTTVAGSCGGDGCFHTHIVPDSRDFVIYCTRSKSLLMTPFWVLSMRTTIFLTTY